ncbi:DUF134 domain-containing protein [Endozoicomonas ascidiicola]|uniref:DUF134 domain-containing protein n=1 Tax=Endozoicomonas ascidiicola TaxID=1698521 RepID=UPI00082DF498|nr:DUF134 domain-containing protein [Endozoicomonas ascidiicola]
MARPRKERRISCRPAFSCFKPNGVAMGELSVISLADDELEALKLVDMDGLSHQDAANELGVSRQTLGNIVAAGRQKVASALINGFALELSSDNQNVDHTTQ